VLAAHTQTHLHHPSVRPVLTSSGMRSKQLDRIIHYRPPPTPSTQTRTHARISRPCNAARCIVPQKGKSCEWDKNVKWKDITDEGIVADVKRKARRKQKLNQECVFHVRTLCPNRPKITHLTSCLALACGW